MPQMSPLMWLNLMIMFSIILLFTIYKMEKISPLKSSKMILKHWKW